MQERGWDAETELDRRLDLVARPENMGEDMRGADYALLFVATLVLPAVLMVVGWFV